MALKLECGICGAIFDHTDVHVFKSTLVSKVGIKRIINIAIRVPVAQNINARDANEMDHICKDCVRSAIGEE
jgi:hypothetical protein